MAKLKYRKPVMSKETERRIEGYKSMSEGLPTKDEWIKIRYYQAQKAWYAQHPSECKVYDKETGEYVVASKWEKCDKDIKNGKYVSRYTIKSNIPKSSPHKGEVDKKVTRVPDWGAKNILKNLQKQKQVTAQAIAKSKQ